MVSESKPDVEVEDFRHGAFSCLEEQSLSVEKSFGIRKNHPNHPLNMILCLFDDVWRHPQKSQTCNFIKYIKYTTRLNIMNLYMPYNRSKE